MRGLRDRTGKEEKGPQEAFPSTTGLGKILLGCALVVIPMIAFTIVILALVFSNIVDDFECPHADICPESPLVNTTSKSHYYVDYSAARLVWISSFSSTVSFVLVGVIMTMFAYHSAHQLLQASSQPNAPDRLLSPYQTSLLIRVLNSDYLSLWDIFSYSRSRSPKQRRREDFNPAQGDKKILRASVVVFCLGIFGSLSIQAADGYLHISTKAVEIIQIVSQPTETYKYSRRIGPWCFDTESIGTTDNINFWGCGVHFDDKTNRIYVANRTRFFEVMIDTLDQNVLNYTDPEGHQYAIVGPADAEPGADWKSSSFAVSTQCTAIPMSACHIVNIGLDDMGVNSWNCSKSLGSPIDLSGQIISAAFAYASLDFHKYLAETMPFTSDIDTNSFTNSTIRNATLEEANEMWYNPWHWVGQTWLPIDQKELLANVNGTAWKMGGKDEGESVMIAHCVSAVYDVVYTAVGGKVTNMEKRLSNSTTAGISITPTLRSFGFINARTYVTGQRASMTPTLETWLATYGYGMSKVYMAPLVVHTLPDADLLAQMRRGKIITQMPAAALWLLVIANLSFALFAVAIAIVAWRASNEAVHQVQVRMGIPGLAAALFEDGGHERAAKSDSKLFDETKNRNKPLVKVGLQPTTSGGMVWMLRDPQTREWHGAKGLLGRFSHDTESSMLSWKGNGAQMQPFVDSSRPSERSELLRSEDTSATSVDHLNVSISSADISSGPWNAQYQTNQQRLWVERCNS